MDLTLVVGTDDPYVTPTRRTRVQKTLAPYDIPGTLDTFEEGHRMGEATLQRVVGASRSS